MMKPRDYIKSKGKVNINLLENYLNEFLTKAFQLKT